MEREKAEDATRNRRPGRSKPDTIYFPLPTFQIRVTLLAAGFIIGAAGASVRELSQARAGCRPERARLVTPLPLS